MTNRQTGENFGGGVGLGAAKGGAGIDNIRFGESKVANLDVEFVIDENIFQFEIPMRNAESMEVADRVQNLLRWLRRCNR